MALLEDKILSFSLLKDGDDDDIRVEKDPDAKAVADIDDMDPDEVSRAWKEAQEAAKMMDAQEKKALDPLAERRHGRKTGPKGVLADAAWHDHLQMKARDREEMKKLDALRTVGYGPRAVDGIEGSIALAHIEHARARDAGSDDDDDAGGEDDSRRRHLERSGASASSRGGGGAVSSVRAHGSDSAAAADAVDDDDDDDEFFAAYRASRMAEIKAAAAAPRFGSVRALANSDEYLAAVDGVDAKALCLVVMHEPFIPACRALLSVLPEVAARNPGVCFFTLESAKISETIDVIGLPSIIIYKGGKTLEACVRVQDAIGERPCAEDVEEWLVAKGVLAASKSVAAAGRRGAASGSGGSTGGRC